MHLQKPAEGSHPETAAHNLPEAADHNRPGPAVRILPDPLMEPQKGLQRVQALMVLQMGSDLQALTLTLIKSDK